MSNDNIYLDLLKCTLYYSTVVVSLLYSKAQHVRDIIMSLLPSQWSGRKKEDERRDRAETSGSGREEKAKRGVERSEQTPVHRS